jgi:hypothetical protein
MKSKPTSHDYRNGGGNRWWAWGRHHPWPRRALVLLARNSTNHPSASVRHRCPSSIHPLDQFVPWARLCCRKSCARVSQSSPVRPAGTTISRGEQRHKSLYWFKLNLTSLD